MTQAGSALASRQGPGQRPGPQGCRGKDGEMASGSVGRRYAKALMAAAEAQKSVDAVARDLERFTATVVASPELGAVLENPAFSMEQRKGVLAGIAQRLKLGKMVVTFLELLLDRNRMTALEAINRSYGELADEAAGRMRVEVTTAEPLSKAYSKRLTEVLEKTLSKKVILTEKVDPEIIGGTITRAGDLMFDGSIRGRLERVRATMLR